jgi:hypothetical protein
MRDTRRYDRDRSRFEDGGSDRPLATGRPRRRRLMSAASALGAIVAVLWLGATPGQAAEATVYYDNDRNVGAGYEVFNAGIPGAFTGNVGLGYSVMPSLTAGAWNVAIGDQALFSTSRGIDNVAIGYKSLYNNTGSSNLALGVGSGINLTNGSRNIAIGSAGAVGESGTIRIGTTGDQTAAYLAGVYGSTVSGRSNLPMIVNSSGKLGTSSVADLLARSGVVKRLRTRVSGLRARLRVKTQRLRQRDRRLADRIRQLREEVREIGGG